MRQARSFRDLLDIDDAVAHALVDGAGDPPERVWAAWVLALRRDPEIASVLRDAAGGDPSPGVRAHMALLLVAHGEHGAAISLARGDPSDLVRATACRHLARVALPDDHRLQELLESVLRTDESPAVHAAIADAIRSDATDAVWRACAARIADANDEVRGNVVDALLRRHAAGEPFPDTLKARASIECDERLRTLILRAWVRAEGLSALLQSLADRPTTEALAVLDFLRDERLEVAGEYLEPLLARDEAVLDARVAALHRRGLVRLPLQWLLELAARHVELADRWTAETRLRWEAMQVAISALAPMLAAATTVSPLERSALERLRAALERDLSAIAASTGASVEALVRYAVDGTPLPTIDSSTERDDDESISVPDWAALLPDMRRLAAT